MAINGNQRTASLVLAKTKVAPIQTLSIPRLELCGAHLAARIVREVNLDLGREQCELFCWTDSKVVISWLSSHPSRWNTFVATRSGDISTLLPTTKWQHVSSKENPADLASRGASPAELRDSRLWWTGPSWLEVGDFPTESIEVPPDEVPERRAAKKTTLVSQTINEEYLLRFSTYSGLLRVTTYSLRFLHYSKVHRRQQGPLIHLSSKQLIKSRNVLIKKVPEALFSAEVKAQKDGLSLPKTSSLLLLRPFIDDDGLLRLAGRLTHSALPYAEKHPIMLPKDSAFTKLLINYAHQQTLHDGRQLTHSYLLHAFWVIHAKVAIRSTLKNCVRCTRFEARPKPQLMGDLPPQRIEEARPFLHSRVDYAGPINIHTTKGRGHRAYKGYICIFVCLAIKAVHIEIASDLTTAAFLAAYKRFVARRGRCAELLSDNGTNFRGADAELSRLFKEASTPQGVAQHLENDGTTWNYIAPGTPHFGGLWEAAVKSTKWHLHKVIGETTLTYEELSTLTAQVEACLNSRSLYVPSSDARDLPAITPAHYLIGTALTAPPEP